MKVGRRPTACSRPNLSLTHARRLSSEKDHPGMPMPTPESKGLLFLCVANSARSQMAEGLARAIAPCGVSVYSAGSEPSRLNPHAVRVMQEVGIDIAAHVSKGIDAVPRKQIAAVITLCAEEVCPVFPAAVEKLHWPFEDPAAVAGSEEDVLEAFRRVRDQLRTAIEVYFHGCDML